MRHNLLFISPKTGIAGDMTISALCHIISQKINQKPFMKKINALSKNLSSIGKIVVEWIDGQGIRLSTIDYLGHPLSILEAQTLLASLIGKLDLSPFHAEFAKKTLAILTEAELVVHSNENITNPTLWNPTTNLFEKTLNKNGHPQVTVKIIRGNDAKTPQTFTINLNEDILNHVHLHEASDVLVDATLTAWCLQELNINSQKNVFLIPPVMVGGGTVKFSHGIFKVPVPAVKYILDVYHVPHASGPVQRELTTPTGAAILAALNPRMISEHEFKSRIEEKQLITGRGFGHAKLDRKNVLTCYFINE